MKKSHKISQRTDIAEQSALEKTAYEYEYHKEAADIKTYSNTCKYGRDCYDRAEIAEVAANKTYAEE